MSSNKRPYQKTQQVRTINIEPSRDINFFWLGLGLGLNIHKGKSRILRYNTECNNRITIDGDLEDVKTFTYLGSIIDEHDGSDADVKAWISKARAAYLQLKNIWNSKQLSSNQHQGHNF
ncbi:unnamed protein product [Schistosoma curassoni]|uniref:Reverse transcriptase domain-containing protein n=1 Tax=Schistosoma curassoni TaxID=6186 RepID=A0A183JUB1_9TREM|nr:unnamed protein product [Schistosoma curassoni]